MDEMIIVNDLDLIYLVRFSEPDEVYYVNKGYNRYMIPCPNCGDYNTAVCGSKYYCEDCMVHMEFYCMGKVEEEGERGGEKDEGTQCQC